MCVCFFNFDHLRITLQSSDLIWGTKFRAPSLPLPPLIFSYLQALSMASYGGELLLDSSFPSSGTSNHISSFSIPLHSSSRSKGLHWWRRSKAYKLHMELRHVVSRESSSRWCSFASSIFLFGQFTLILCSSSYSPYISSIVLWFWCFLE